MGPNSHFATRLARYPIPGRRSCPVALVAMSSPVTYDRRSFKLHGSPFLILSGSVHYIRLHPSRWERLFDTFLAANLNTLETYVFWGEHDHAPDVRSAPHPTPHERPPLYDFSGRLDLFSFISAAGARGLRVILRIGPYVCAEASYGGFPSRLRFVPDIELRTFNRPFMCEVETWVLHVASRLKEERLLAPQGGPVILVQLENEYSMVSEAYGDEGGKYLQWCADLQKEIDFGVPGIMCYGAADGVVETINAFYAHEEIDGHRKRHPDQPPVWTECWTGWYDVWGAPHHIRKAEDLAYAVARFFAKGGAGVNYYMWMGGSNFGRSPMYLQKTSYDYDAPVDEFYQETTKSRHLARLHEVLLEAFAKQLHERREDDPPFEDGRIYRWGNTFFLCNDTDKPLTDVPLPGSDQVYDGVIAAKSVCIIDGRSSVLRFDTSRIHPGDIVARKLVPVQTTVTRQWERMTEPVPRWDTIEAIAAASNLGARPVTMSPTPPEQLSLTQDSSDYCFYTARYSCTGGTHTNRKVAFEAADFATVFVNGNVACRTAVPLWEDRWPNKWNAYPEGSPGTRHTLEVGTNTETLDVTVLTASLGLVKGDWQLGKGRNMLDERKGLLSDLEIEGFERETEWKALPKLHGEVCGWGQNGWDGLGWYRCTVTVQERSDNWVVDLGGCGKGLLYVNERLLGRYWLVEGTRPKNGFLDGSPVEQERKGEPTQRYYHVPQWVGKEVENGVELTFVLFAEYGEAPKDIELFTVQ